MTQRASVAFAAQLMKGFAENAAGKRLKYFPLIKNSGIEQHWWDELTSVCTEASYLGNVHGIGACCFSEKEVTFEEANGTAVSRTLNMGLSHFKVVVPEQGAVSTKAYGFFRFGKGTGVLPNNFRKPVKSKPKPRPPAEWASAMGVPINIGRQEL